MIDMRARLQVAFALLATASLLAGQEDADRGISPTRLREVVSYLASDDMAGRDSPSAELERAADWIARRFAAAGLRPGGTEGSWFHRFRLPGYRPLGAGARVVAHTAGGDLELRVGDDVRLFRGTGPFSCRRCAFLRLTGRNASAPARRLRGSRPVVVEVSKESILWRSRPPERSVLRRGRGGPPWLLVRKGLLPPGEVEWTVELPEPAAVEVELRNVIGVLPATTASESPCEAVVFSAHYDHLGVGVPVGGDAVYNGADDDASGTAAVVVLAEAFGARRPQLARDLLFVCFAAEEKGLLGSRALAAHPGFPLRRIAANVNIEMIGRPPEGRRRAAWVTGAELSDFVEIVRPALARANVRLVDFRAASMLFRASDNYPLARRGVVAHSISAGSLHRDYHRPSDEVEKLDFGHMTAIVQGLYEVGVELANTERRPAYNERGRALLRLH